MKQMFEEFKAFALKGNVVDMAVGVVIGSAFTAIVNSLVADIITPLFTLLGPDTEVFAAMTLGPLAIGNFINAVISFLLVSLSLFAVVKMINRLSRKKAAKEAEQEPPIPQPSTEEKLLMEIRDLLKLAQK